MGGFLHNALALPSEPGLPYTHLFSPRDPEPGPGAVEWLRTEIAGDLARAQYLLDKLGGRRASRHEMHDAIADCEFKLALLDLHHPVTEDYLDGDGQDRSSSECDECDPAGSADNWPCRTIRLLAGAYHERDGYGRLWGPPVTHTITEAGLRAALADLSASEHADWKPHVTRAYLEPGDPLPAPHPPVPVTFTHLSVHCGGDVQRFPLGTKEAS
jgi:hypothetical protein